MRGGIAQSRWVFLVHCVESVRKVLLRKSEKIGCLESKLSQLTKAFMKEREVVRENKEKEGV